MGKNKRKGKNKRAWRAEHQFDYDDDDYLDERRGRRPLRK